jgi:hypothetical protein
MMNAVVITKIIRIKNCHLTQLMGSVKTLMDVERSLAELGFKMTESTSDDFFRNYESEDYNNENRNTIINVRGGDEVNDITFTMFAAEGVNFGR